MLFRANIVLALVAWRDGDRKAALGYLSDASGAPRPTDGPRRYPWMLEERLTNNMLKHGERTTVIEYLERASKTRDAVDRNRMLEDAAAIRDGRMPPRYQELLTKGHI